MIPFLVVCGIILLFIAIWLVIRYSLNYEKNIENNGIETDAVVTRVILSDRDNNSKRYDTYVSFTGDDSNKHEGRIINVSFNFPVGRKMRIKYIPGKYDLCYFVSQEIN